MKTITIEWKRLDRGGRTRTRCGDTGRSPRSAVRDRRRRCPPCGVTIKCIETRLRTRQLKESRTVLLNGTPLETALGDAKVRANNCGSCSTLAGEAPPCRAVQRRGKTYEALPEERIWKAACRVADSECLVDAAGRR